VPNDTMLSDLRHASRQVSARVYATAENTFSRSKCCAFVDGPRGLFLVARPHALTFCMWAGCHGTARLVMTCGAVMARYARTTSSLESSGCAPSVAAVALGRMSSIEIMPAMEPSWLMTGKRRTLPASMARSAT